MEEISKSLQLNIDDINKIYATDRNQGLVIQEFNIDNEFSAAAIYFSSMVDRTIVEKIMRQLIALQGKIDYNTSVEDIVWYRLTPIVKTKRVQTVDDEKETINNGNILIIIDGIAIGFNCDVQGWASRAVDKPSTENSIKGPQEGFVESYETNTALVRKNIRNEKVIIEEVEVGTKYKSKCGILYMDGIVKEDVLTDLKKRLDAITIEFVSTTGNLEQLIEDEPYSVFPQAITTENPESVAVYLLEGRVAIILDGNPYALVIPASINDLFYSVDDDSLRIPFKVFSKCIRMIAILFSLLVGPVYVALVSFHQEIIPINLLITIVKAKQNVPFPFFIELLFMEITFEIVQESKLRVPTQIGEIIGVVGSLILGEAAVAANIVSPITLILSAMAIITSLAIPRFYFAYGIKIIKFMLLFVAASFGFLGIISMLFAISMYISSKAAFDIDFVPDFFIKKGENVPKSIFNTPIGGKEIKPYFMKKNQG